MCGYELLQALSHCDLTQKIEVMFNDESFVLKAVIPEEIHATHDRMITLYIGKEA